MCQKFRRAWELFPRRVGGWKTRGVDSGIMARGIATGCQTAHRQGKIAPKDILTASYDEIQNNGTIVGGSTTACLLVFSIDGNDDLCFHSCNLGDSAYKVFRGGFMMKELTFQSSLLRHGEGRFCPPYQLAALGEPFKHLPVCNDLPKDADLIGPWALLPGDVVVVATDGVWDNMTQQDMEAIVSDPETDGPAKANEIVGLAARNAWKLDDITCIVAMARPWSDEQCKKRGLPADSAGLAPKPKKQFKPKVKPNIVLSATPAQAEISSLSTPAAEFCEWLRRRMRGDDDDLPMGFLQC